MKTVKLTMTHLQRSEWIRQLNAMSSQYPVRNTLRNMLRQGAQTALQINDDNEIVAFITMMPGILEGESVALVFGNAPGATDQFAEQAMRLYGHKILRMQIPQKHFHAEAERLGILKNFCTLHRREKITGTFPEGVELCSGEVFQTLSGDDLVDIRNLLRYAVSVEEKFDKLGRDHVSHYDPQRVLSRMQGDDKFMGFGFFAMVTRVDGKVAGLITAEAGSEWIEINGLAVAELHQRKGIATKLVKGMLHMVGEYYDQAAVMVFSNNVGSLELFEKLGFVEESALFMKIVED